VSPVTDNLPRVRCHLQAMPLGRRKAADYTEIAGEEQIARLQEAAQPLKGARLLHLAAAGSRLRSPEILPSLLSLYEDLGLHAGYQVLTGDRPLWRLTRQLEDGIQGGETAISDEAWAEYLEDSPTPTGYDVVIAHGPGPLATAAKAGTAYVFRCELGRGELERLNPLIDGSDAIADLPEAVDPLSPASIDLPIKLAGSMLKSLGVDLTRPTIFQARPFDTWQDPHEVIDAFMDTDVPGLQLVLAGDPQSDDVEAWRLLREVSDYADTRDNLLLLRNVGDVELNALRALARAGVESALAKGSELTALETLWKRTPVAEASAERITELVTDPGLAIELGEAGHERVRAGHLITTLAESELRLLASFQSA
jgi:trehalose synthase